VGSTTLAEALDRADDVELSCSTSDCRMAMDLTQCANLAGEALIVISARGDEVDRILALELGADDYLAKPFRPGS